MVETVSGIDGIPCQGYTILNDEKSILLSYPNGSKGVSFHHGKFISKLRDSAKSVVGVTTLEGTASELIKCPNSNNVIGVKVSVKDPITLAVSSVDCFAKLTIVADGCFSKFRKQVTPLIPIVKSHFVGLVLRDCPLPCPQHGHVILAQPSPILMYQIGSRDTRILIDIPGKLPAGNDMKRYLLQDILPQLPSVVRPSFKEAVETQRVRSMPNGWLPPSRQTLPGLFVIGDAINMRHPLTGGGMTVALNDVMHLNNVLKSKLESSSVRDLNQELSLLFYKRKSTSSVINVLANALYTLFSAGKDPQMVQLQQACFQYLGLGGLYSDEPVSLLAGLMNSPWTLILHFFSVAMYAVVLQVGNKPLYSVPYHFVLSMFTLMRAAAVILPLLLSEL